MILRITPWLAIDDALIVEDFVRASGPGGQNVNKLSTAVQLRFPVYGNPDLPPDVAERLARLAGRRLTLEGVIVIMAQRFRTQERNRADARERLLKLIGQAAERPLTRRPTRPTLGSKTRRLEAKSRRSGIKSLRRVKPDAD
jgi:ribosome-associated protein